MSTTCAELFPAQDKHLGCEPCVASHYHTVARKASSIDPHARSPNIKIWVVEQEDNQDFDGRTTFTTNRK
ncbi:hypothetical protein TNIN_201861 [Trichonephila inaurata madagascariensis]|uniref:Uncharacterized protein n=1 Tax=Trichonephila inaurata madagascariensis TaxID=2747483 RepID=A0A8X7CRE0_9ARAC|nr:hypothetical protein TNIN_201861 [Trichonephila inaurata madagascariensis]